MEFRAETMAYSKSKRRELKNREAYLQEKLDALDNEICHGHDHISQSLLDEYESIKTELKDIYEKKPCSAQKPARLKSHQLFLSET